MALELGEPNVDVMLSNMTASQSAEWAEFFDLEPFGFPVSNIQNGIIGAAIANFSGSSKKRFKNSDFMIKPSGDRQTPEDQFSIFKAMASKQKKT